MSDRPFHHGNLRAVLLDRAEGTLRADGIDALSLRELAREAGVSHGAPRRHFADRQALLNALAERGFLRLAEQVQAVVADSTDDDTVGYEQRLRAAARAYVRFAIDDSALLELMFAAKNAKPPPALDEAAERFFVAVSALITQGVRIGRLAPGEPGGLQLLLVATLQGIAALVVSRRLPLEHVDALIDDAVALFTCDRRPGTVRPGG